jgi:Zn-finger nucleic acid-binding protein
MMKCPVCHIPLCRIDRGGVPISVCPDCWGALVEHDRFRSIRKKDARGVSAQEALPAPEAPRGTDHEEPLRCPRCLAKMAKVKQGPQAAPFQLDVCAPCAMIWFDKGELDRARAALAAQAPLDEDLAERKALAEMELEESADRTRRLTAVASDVTHVLARVLYGPWWAP